MLRTVRTVIVDEIHALVRDKRGAHLALSLERLEALSGPPAPAARALGHAEAARGGRAPSWRAPGRACRLVDAGSFRDARPRGRGAAVAARAPSARTSSGRRSTRRLAELVREHRTTLVFVNTRKMAERIAAQLTKILGEEAVTSHHGSLSKERRLDAEQRLKAGSLRALVATASLELGHRHRRGRPRGPGGRHALDRDAAAARRPRGPRARPRARRAASSRSRSTSSWRRRRSCAACATSLLDRTAQPPRPLDILAQQIVAECVGRASWDEDGAVRRAEARLALPRARARGVRRGGAAARRKRPARAAPPRRRRRAARAPRAARGSRPSSRAAPSRTPPTTRCGVEPEGTLVGTVNEDWAIESNGGDIFQLGNASWRILRVEPGIVRVADAKGQPPSIPFWLGEGPGRTRELSAAIADLREACADAGRAARGRRRGRAAGRRRRRAARRSAARRSRRAGGAAARRVRARRPHGARLRAHAAARRARALLRRGRRHAARGARALRLAHQPRLGPGAAQALLRRLRLRAAGRGQRGGHRAEPRAAAQLPARGGLRLPAPADAPATCWCRRCSPAPMFGDALALERAALAAARARAQRQAGAGGAPAHARRGPAGRRPSRRCWPAPRRCPAARSPVPDDHPIVRQTDRGLPDRGHGRGRLPRGAARARATARSSAAPSTRPSRRRSRAASCRASPTRSSTTRRSRSAARRR